VLVVDDDPIFRKLVVAMLSRTAAPLPAATLAEALAKAKDADAALLDLTLPDGRGADLVARLRAVAPALSIVVLSGEDDPAVRRACLAAGAKAFLLKGGIDGAALEKALA
jgi:two-component system KDP operon response regulator KdpE